jgi:anaerobic selenocysteine-containing dehydrogenase
VVDGEVKKIEGNPDHPIGRGGVCALGQSAPQGLYDPDRILAPQRRAEGGWETVAWEAALQEVAERLADARVRGAESIAIVASPDGVLEGLWRRFAAALDGALFVRAEPDDAVVERQAAQIVLGRAELPRYHLSEADLVLTIGADFLDRWRSPVHLARALQDARERDLRTRFVAATPRMSLTAARADQWLPVRPGTEGVLARALAGALLAAGRPSEAAVARYRALFPAEPPALETAAEVCDIAVGRLRDLAEALVRARRAVVLGGGSAGLGADGLSQVTAILALSVLAGGEEAPAVSLPPARGGRLTEGAVEPISVAELARRLAGGQIELLLVADADPLHGASPRLREAWGSAAHVVTLDSAFSDTALASELVLPTQVDLERLVAVVPQGGPAGVAVSLAQPVRAARGEARHPGDVALALAATQDRLAVELPWASFEELVQSVVAESDRAAERRAFDAGFWPENEGELASAAPNADAAETRPSSASSRSSSASSRTSSALVRGGAVPSLPILRDPAAASRASADEGALRLIPYESVKGGAGTSNRPWLQELPDPMSTVMWATAAELSPHDAERLGLETGDRVRLSSAGAAAQGAPHETTVEAVVFVTPAARPGTVAVPIGGGASGRGRFAENRGGNPHRLATAEVEAVGVAALGDATVTLTKVERAPRAAVYGRGLRRAEDIPRGWRPHVPKTRGRATGAPAAETSEPAPEPGEATEPGEAAEPGENA